MRTLKDADQRPSVPGRTPPNLLASMLSRGAIYDREPKTDSVDFFGTYKRLKERLSNGGRHSTADVDHTNMNKPLGLDNRDLDPSWSKSERRRLSGVEQKVIDSLPSFAQSRTRQAACSTILFRDAQQRCSVWPVFVCRRRESSIPVMSWNSAYISCRSYLRSN